MSRMMSLIIGAIVALGSAKVVAEGSGHEHHMEEGNTNMDMSGMEMAPGMTHEMNHTGHAEMEQPLADGPRDPHAWSDGYDFGSVTKPHLHNEHPLGGLLVERLEGVHVDHNSMAAYELRGWYGYDYDRLLLKAEGDVDGGELEEAATELLWSHAIAAFWNSQLGLRHDSGSDADRNWLAMGVEGLSPYWFDIDANLYFGKDGRSAATLSAEYELLLTQRLILQPHLELNLNGKSDSERLEGTGLTDVIAGIRLRYEIRRQFAPYVGIEWAGKFGSTADMARNAGEDANEQRLVAGVRFWF